MNVDEEFSNETMGNSEVTVLLVEPGRFPLKTSIANIRRFPESAEEDIRGLIEGEIEPIGRACFERDGIQILCNDMGKVNGMQQNRALRDPDNGNEIFDIVSGPFVITGLDMARGGELDALQLNKYMTIFQYPEFFRRDREGNITVWTTHEPFETADIDSLPLVGTVPPDTEHPYNGTLRVHEACNDWPRDPAIITRVLVSQGIDKDHMLYPAVWRNVKLDSNSDLSFDLYGRHFKLDDVQWEQNRKQDQPSH